MMLAPSTSWCYSVPVPCNQGAGIGLPEKIGGHTALIGGFLCPSHGKPVMGGLMRGAFERAGSLSAGRPTRMCPLTRDWSHGRGKTHKIGVIAMTPPATNPSVLTETDLLAALAAWQNKHYTDYRKTILHWLNAGQFDLVGAALAGTARSEAAAVTNPDADKRSPANQ